MMKQKSIIFSVIFLMVVIITRCFGEYDPVQVKYGETYMCGKSFSVDIVNQPILVSQSMEKLSYSYYEQESVAWWRFWRQRNTSDHSVNIEEFKDSVNSNTMVKINPKQFVINYGKASGDDVLMEIRLRIRNLNSITFQGLNRESFALVGKVRGRDMVYYPEVMMPYEVKSSYWLHYFLNQGYRPYTLRNVLQDKDMHVFDIQDIGPYLVSQQLWDPLRVSEIRLIYRVRPFLVNWELRVNPKPEYGFSEENKHARYLNPRFTECMLTLLLPTVKNEITNTVYQYTW